MRTSDNLHQRLKDLNEIIIIELGVNLRKPQNGTPYYNALRIFIAITRDFCPIADITKFLRKDRTTLIYHHHKHLDLMTVDQSYKSLFLMIKNSYYEN